ncbi:hypothetical protein [Methylobacterium flocculans]|uniref:hypothetical protein n=1 Tax=Methylobacterium flocculans TaxID=2984843 RepID=UPI0021F3B885|nr:hypothetical protein [Methylobacterium sp. FF17]
MTRRSLADRAPYRVRPGTRATVEDRHGESAFVVIEPVNFPADRIAFAEAWVEQANAFVRRSAAQRSTLPQAAE